MAGTKSPEQTTSSKPRSVYSELSDLVLLMGDAKGEVDRAHTIVGRQQDLSEEDWARLRSIVFACADKMRSVETTRREAMGQISIAQAIFAIVDEEREKVNDEGEPSLEAVVELRDLVGRLDSAEREVVTARMVAMVQADIRKSGSEMMQGVMHAKLTNALLNAMKADENSRRP